MRILVVIGILIAASMPAFAQSPPKLNERLLRLALEDHLKDADSAKFRAVKFKKSDAPGMWDMCGEVNSKNSYGGYAGFDPFLGAAIKNGNSSVQYLVLGMGDAAGAVCESKGLR